MVQVINPLLSINFIFLAPPSGILQSIKSDIVPISTFVKSILSCSVNKFISFGSTPLYFSSFSPTLTNGFPFPTFSICIIKVLTVCSIEVTFIGPALVPTSLLPIISQIPAAPIDKLCRDFAHILVIALDSKGKIACATIGDS